MATPLPAVPPPPGPAPADTPESRDPLADRAHAAALDATLSRGRAALFDATLKLRELEDDHARRRKQVRNAHRTSEQFASWRESELHALWAAPLKDTRASMVRDSKQTCGRAAMHPVFAAGLALVGTALAWLLR